VSLCVCVCVCVCDLYSHRTARNAFNLKELVSKNYTTLTAYCLFGDMKGMRANGDQPVNSIEI